MNQFAVGSEQLAAGAGVARAVPDREPVGTSSRPSGTSGPTSGGMPGALAGVPETYDELLKRACRQGRELTACRAMLADSTEIMQTAIRLLKLLASLNAAQKKALVSSDRWGTIWTGIGIGSLIVTFVMAWLAMH